MRDFRGNKETKQYDRRRLTRQERRKLAIKRRRMILLGIGSSVLVLIFVILGIKNLFTSEVEEETSGEYVLEIVETVVDNVDMPEIDVQLLTVNEYSRPGYEIEEVLNVVIHYTANPGTTAQQNRDYFDSLAESGDASVSSNFVVGIDGEIIQCIPTDEVAYASSHANSTSISIEVCHEDTTGEFTEAAYESVVHLTAWLCEEFGLDSEDVIRHYDVTGKACPLYYVENEDEWILLKSDVADMLNGIV